MNLSQSDEVYFVLLHGVVLSMGIRNTITTLYKI